MDEAPLRLLIVADDPLARAGLAGLISDRPEVAVVGQIVGGDGVADAVEVYSPDIIVWDLGWDPSDALTSASDVTDLGTPIVGLLHDATPAQEARSVGLTGLVQRDVSSAALTAALLAVANGLVVQDAAFDATSQDEDHRLPLPPAEPLTPREMEVLELLAKGLPNKAIAHRLDVTDHTVKFHVNSILTKLNVQSRTEAVVNATRLGLILL